MQHARDAADEKIHALKREHEVQLASAERIHAAEVERQRELQRAATLARERQFEQQLIDAAAIHRAQLDAYSKIKEEGGELHSLASEVRGTAEALVGLRERMDNDISTLLLAKEGDLAKKESALNEVNAERQRLWMQRESLVASMQVELTNEQQRMAKAWEQTLGGWDRLQGEHAAMLEGIRERREEATKQSKVLADECGHANAALKAEVAMLGQERAACREERRSLSTALLQHRQEVSKHREWLFGAMESVAREREASVYQVLSAEC